MEIKQTEEWRALMKEMHRKLENYKQAVLAAARTGELPQISQSVGSHDGFKEAIKHLEDQ